MIGIIFSKGSEHLEVRIDGTSVYFRTSQFTKWADISGLELSREGSIKEFPELKDDPNWRTKVIKKFKEKIKEYPSELARMQYIIEDLRIHGYTATYFQEKGHRPIKLKDGKQPVW